MLKTWETGARLDVNFPCSGSVNQSCAQLFATPWTVAYQTPLSIGFPKQEYWSGLPFVSPGDLPDPRIESPSLLSPALAL